MSKVRMQLVRLMAGTAGSVMLEYSIVLLAVGVALAVFLLRAFFGVGSGFGPLGQDIVAFYQRTLGGLSLPIP